MTDRPIAHNQAAVIASQANSSDTLNTGIQRYSSATSTSHASDTILSDGRPKGFFSLDAVDTV